MNQPQFFSLEIYFYFFMYYIFSKIVMCLLEYFFRQCCQLDLVIYEIEHRFSIFTILHFEFHSYDAVRECCVCHQGAGEGKCLLLHDKWGCARPLQAHTHTIHDLLMMRRPHKAARTLLASVRRGCWLYANLHARRPLGRRRYGTGCRARARSEMKLSLSRLFLACLRDAIRGVMLLTRQFFHSI
jgi:hypothetical protein